MGILTDRGGDGPHLTRLDEAGFVEAVGERIALFGHRRLECWMWPLLLFEELELAVRPAGETEPLPPPPRRVRVVPEGLALEWIYPDFTLELEAFACLERRALVILIAARAEGPVEPLEVDLRLRPALRPMWPAGLGGRVSGRDAETGALFLTEELGRFAALIGSPDGRRPELSTERGLPEVVTITLPLPPRGEVAGAARVLVAGAELEARPLSEEARRGGSQSARGTSRAEEALAAARTLYRELCESWREELEALRTHWTRFLARGAHLECGDPAVDGAFLWSRIAIERLWARVDGLEPGLLAGLGPSRGGDRPGLGWFFGGDALAVSRALTSLGDYQGARRALRFVASTQRDDGKLAHEWTLSHRLVDWVGDYPYAYYKGQVTPGFVACLDHYVHTSDDRDLARELWPTAERAIAWCARACDLQGWLLVPEAGIAAVEAGPLANRIRSELYLQGIWCSALDGALRLAALLGKGERASVWEELRGRARRALASAFHPDLGRYAFAELEGGETFDEPSVYVALPLSRDLGQDARVARSAVALNRPELMADWGGRMFATSSEVYDPDDYNSGSVFPYLTAFAVLALYRQGFPDAAWPVLRSQVGLDGMGGLGYLPEFLAGDRARLPQRSVPHQAFSQSALLVGCLHGLAGIEADGTTGVLTLRPALPLSLPRLALRALPVGDSRLDLFLERRRTQGRTSLRTRVEVRSGPPVAVVPELTLPPLTVVEALEVDGQQHPWRARSLPGGALSVAPEGPPTAASRFESELVVRAGPALDLAAEVQPDAASRHPRLVGQLLDGDALLWTFAGLAGTRARLEFASDLPLTVEGAALDGDHLSIDFPPGEGFTDRRVRLHLS